MSFVEPSAARKRTLDEIAPPLSSDAPASALPNKIPAHYAGHQQQYPSQYHHHHMHATHLHAPPLHQQPHQQQQQHLPYPRRVYGSPPRESHQLHSMRMNLQQPQLSPVVPSSASTPANGALPARARHSAFNVMDVQNKSPRKAPAKSRYAGLDHEHEQKTPVVRPGMNPHHDVLMAAHDDVLALERRNEHWDIDHAMPYSPIYVNSNVDNDMVRRLVAAPPPPPQQLQHQPQQHQPLLAPPPAAPVEQNENKAPVAPRVTKPVAMRAFVPAVSEPVQQPVRATPLYFVLRLFCCSNSQLMCVFG